MIRAAAIACGIVAATLTGSAGAAQLGTFAYTINDDSHGNVGTFTNVVSRKGQDIVVRNRTRVRVKVMFVTVHRYESDTEAVWRDGRLLSFSGKVFDNGKRATFRGRAEGGKFVIESTGGKLSAPGSVFPIYPWSIAVVRTRSILDAELPKLYDVEISPDGDETIARAGRNVTARKFAVKGDVEARLWFDPRDIPIRFVLRRDDDDVTFTLQPG